MRHCQNLALSLRLVQLKDRQVALTDCLSTAPTRYAPIAFALAAIAHSSVLPDPEQAMNKSVARIDGVVVSPTT